MSLMKSLDEHGHVQFSYHRVLWPVLPPPQTQLMSSPSPGAICECNSSRKRAELAQRRSPSLAVPPPSGSRQRSSSGRGAGGRCGRLCEEGAPLLGVAVLLLLLLWPAHARHGLLTCCAQAACRAGPVLGVEDRSRSSCFGSVGGGRRCCCRLLLLISNLVQNEPPHIPNTTDEKIVNSAEI